MNVKEAKKATLSIRYRKKLRMLKYFLPGVIKQNLPAWRCVSEVNYIVPISFGRERYLFVVRSFYVGLEPQFF